jgi:hypothetical protein
MHVHHERQTGPRDRELMLVLGGAGFSSCTCVVDARDEAVIVGVR